MKAVKSNNHELCVELFECQPPHERLSHYPRPFMANQRDST